MELARELVLEAGERLRRDGEQDKGVTWKTGHQDLVTRCDRETEQFLRSRLFKEYPRDRVVGEEYEQAGEGKSPAVWYIDPIDGTTNFINEHRDYAISVGCYVGGKPEFGLVFDVYSHKLYSARAGEGAFCNGTPLHTARRQKVEEMLLLTPDILHTFIKPHPRQKALIRLAEELRGMRSRGTVALELCAVAAGEGDLFVTTRSSPWDHNAARLILTEAGGAICTLEGKELPADTGGTILAGNSAPTVSMILGKMGI